MNHFLPQHFRIIHIFALFSIHLSAIIVSAVKRQRSVHLEKALGDFCWLLVMVFFSHAITRIELYQFRAHAELAKPLPSADEFSFSDIFRILQCLEIPISGCSSKCHHSLQNASSSFTAWR